MPKRRVDDAPHVIMTDHAIQRRAPANALAEFPERPAEEYRGSVVPYYPAPLANTPRNDLYRAVAQVGLGNNVAVGLPVLARLVEQVKPREPEFYMVLGDGWKMADNLQEAAKAYRQALQIAPDSMRAMRALAAVDAEHAEQILAQAVEMAPNDAESWFRYGVLTRSAERIQKAIDLDPWLPDQSRRLAELTHSEAALKDALRSDPFDDAAWDLGGRILVEKGKLADAFFDFERAVKLIPSGRYLYDYALALVRADRFDEAQARAEMSVQADGTLADSHELLGGLYARKKQLADAAREYTAALALSRGSLTPNTGSPTLSAGSPTVNAGSPAPNSGSPSLNTGSLGLNAGSPALNAGSPAISAGSARLELRLGTVLAAMGDKAGAAPHLREAAKASDAAIARQAEQALRELGIR
jgi:tetratricopeptide (TPR) repeat protein